MKEWFVRFCCVLMGVAITLGSIKVKEFIEPPVQEQELEEVEIDMLPKEVAKEEDYKMEAEIKYEEIASVTPVVEEIEETPEVQEIKANETLVWRTDYPVIDSDMTLDEKMAIRSSYDETMATNTLDKMVIENNTIDFSNVKITVIGDSITAGNTLPEGETEKYSWPVQLGQILGCKVVNLGIGGSTVSRVVDNYPMVDRWSKTDSDSDIIIVMGGSNDMLFEDKWMFGELEYEHRMTSGTFCGDLDEMLGAMMWQYQDHNDENGPSKFIYINPPSCILQDGVYNVDPGNMVHQSKFAEAINTIAPAYGFSVIDLYNNNFLNSHDPDINAMFIPDGIHGNKEGYRILAEHVASYIIQRVASNR